MAVHSSHFSRQDITKFVYISYDVNLVAGRDKPNIFFFEKGDNLSIGRVWLFKEKIKNLAVYVASSTHVDGSPEEMTETIRRFSASGPEAHPRFHT